MTKARTCCDEGRLPEGDDDLIDFHTHILPRIYDGSGSSQESLELLSLGKSRELIGLFLHHIFMRGRIR